MTSSTGLITGYVPKMVLTIVGLACFGLLAAIFWFRFFHQGTHRWMLPLCIGTTTMMLGFVIRIPMTNSPDSLGIYCIQTLFILLSPCAFLAQNYMILPRLATWLDSEQCLFMSSRRIVRIFVWSDVITFWVQAAGGGLSVSNGTMSTVGYWVTMAGLVIQLLSFSTFIALLLIFGYRVKSKSPGKWTNRIQIRAMDGRTTAITASFLHDWRSLYYAVIWSCIGIIIRCIYRIAEYAQGYNGTLRTTEMYFYIFDSLPLFLAISVWVFIWPPTILRADTEPATESQYDIGAGAYGGRGKNHTGR